VVPGTLEIRIAPSAREALTATPVVLDQNFTAPAETPL
jgi:beta-glucosidase